LPKSSICAITWFAKDEDITYDGWPVPQPRFTRRPFGEQDDPLAVGEDDVVDLRLDVLPRVLLERRDLDLVVEVADVAHDRVVLHALHVLVVITWKLPVAVTKMSALSAAYSMVTTR
jgi:hypothetical protein